MSTEGSAIATKTAANISIPRWVTVSCLVVILGFAAFVRIRLLEMPLERDEGEYAYAGQLMLQGIPPYKLAYNMKLPGTYAAYAVIMAAFGETTRGIHLGLILVNSLTTILVYFLGRSLFGKICGLSAAACFVLLSLSESVFGLAAHATHFVTLFAVAGAWLLSHAIRNDRNHLVFWSGILLGISFIMKQQAICFVAFGAAAVFLREITHSPRQWRRIVSRTAVFGSGVALPFAIVCLLLLAAGVFPRFWFWTFDYASQYASIIPLRRGMQNLRREILALVFAAPFLWFLFATGTLFAWSRARHRESLWFTTGFFAAAFASACPGLYFRDHYFIPLLPAVGLFVGAALQLISEQTRSKARFMVGFATVLLFAAFAQDVIRAKELFFKLDANAAVRHIYGNNPFPESVEIARYIRDHSKPDSLIAVLGSEPQIYFYSGRHSATGYIYTYPLMEPHRFAGTMQNEMISQIEATKPEFVVLVNVVDSWLARPSSSRAIFTWFETFGPKNYRYVGLIDTGLEQAIYRWDEKAIAARPRSSSFVGVFRRNDLF